MEKEKHGMPQAHPGNPAAFGPASDVAAAESTHHGVLAHTWPTSPRPSVEEILRAVRITSLTRELDLSYARGLTPRTLKALFACLPNLRKLTMRYTDLTRLPDAFASVPELRELDFSFNAFTYLPPSIGALTRLASPRRALELGTGMGLTTHHILSNLPPDGVLDSVESDEALIEVGAMPENG